MDLHVVLYFVPVCDSCIEYCIHGVSLDLPIFVVLIGAVPLAMLVDHGFVESFLGLGENCFETG
jgi:hypothetical protein